MRDLKTQVDFSTSLKPQAMTATAQGTGIDLRGYDGATLHLNVGTLTDGTFTPTVEESDDNSSFSTVAAADMIGTLAALVTLTDQRIGYIGFKRYVRCVMTVTGSPGTGCVLAATFARGYPHQQPLA